MKGDINSGKIIVMSLVRAFKKSTVRIVVELKRSSRKNGTVRKHVTVSPTVLKKVNFKFYMKPHCSRFRLCRHTIETNCRCIWRCILFVVASRMDIFSYCRSSTTSPFVCFYFQSEITKKVILLKQKKKKRVLQSCSG